MRKLAFTLFLISLGLISRGLSRAGFIFFFCFICFSAKANFYASFGVEQGASDKEIRQAYKRAVFLLHPDKYTDPKEKKSMEEVFKKIQAMYAVLSDPEQRRLYDQYLSETAGASQREDFDSWKDRHSLKNRGSRANSSSRSSASGRRSANSSSSQKEAGSRSQNSSRQNPPYSGTQLHHAILSEDPFKAYDFAEELLKRGGFDINAKDSNGDTVLTLAIRMNRGKIVQLLLDQGVGIDINAKDKNGNTALILAIKMNRVKMVQSLLKRGADPNIYGSDGQPLAHTILLIMANNKKRKVQKIYEWSDKERFFNMLLWLKSAGINLAAKNSSGQTALQFSLAQEFLYGTVSKNHSYRGHYKLKGWTDYSEALIMFMIRNGFADYLENAPQQERAQIDTLLIQRGLLEPFRFLPAYFERKRSEGERRRQGERKEAHLREARPPDMSLFDRCLNFFRRFAAE